MPAIHLQTITVVLLLFSLTSAVAVAVVAWGRPASDGLRWWTWGLILQCLSYGFFLLRDLGWPLASIVLVNVATPASIAMHIKAVADFQGVRLRPAAIWLPAALYMAAGPLLSDDPAARTAVTSMLGAVQAATLGWAAYRVAPELRRERGRLLLLSGVALLLATFIARVLAVVTAEMVVSMTVTDGLQSASYFAALVVILVNTMGYVSMHMERAETRLQHEATHDALTGVANRRAAMQTLEREWSRAQRTGSPLAVLMIDLDHFKKVNDSHGHQVGDVVLREMSHRIQARVRAQDVVARYGGEEFLVVLPDTDAQGAMAVAEQLREQAGAPMEADGHRLTVTVSVGVHSRTVPRGNEASDTMVAAADRALYRAKESGRNRSMLEGAPA